MADEKTKKEEKIELEREYVVPMRRGFSKVPRYKKANKAIKTLKEFIAKHMKVENRDTRNVKVDKLVNEEIWQRGIKKPLHKIKVKAIKKDGIVYVELAEISDFVKYKIQKIENRNKKISQQDKKTDKGEKKKGEINEEKEKDKSLEEKENKKHKQEAKTEKHTTDLKKEVKAQRKTLKK